MNKNIYKTSIAIQKHKNPKRPTYQTPDYIQFCDSIQKEIDRQNTDESEEPIHYIAHHRLYSVWHVSKTFRKHWNAAPSHDSVNGMLYSLIACWGWTVEQAECAMVVFWRRHDAGNLRERTKKMQQQADKIWKELEAKREDERKNRLRERIIRALEEQPYGTKELAIVLNAHAKAVDGHLVRLVKEGIAVKIKRGLYGLSGEEYAAQGK